MIKLSIDENQQIGTLHSKLANDSPRDLNPKKHASGCMGNLYLIPQSSFKDADITSSSHFVEHGKRLLVSFPGAF